MASRLPLFAAALWWGSLTAVGFMVVPMLFAHLPTPAMAGRMAARLFSAQTWVSVACGAALLLVLKQNVAEAGVDTERKAIIIVVAGLLLALLVEFAVAPRIVARQDLRLWHGVGTVLYALQWLCAAALLWRLGGGKRG
ncbi:DUF4149 domain-containing protein [Ottowia sp.]|jgi:hypothetical protein|uniref:DUF4149 domain-containing protein n=1 Tax=Ottowia sp. TaxID=1898956 RepID=UPI0025CC7EF6|nr:DUF4149 domain-containing protein [Ottowia sp.]MBK6615953.1 DUF4149 domain-containing protein [Ottowia sp.]MBK6747075.1 DUF4149 domain-containing protein [Ottowia sp.]